MTWYNKGLSFKCTQCAGCCQGSSGYVWVTKEDIVQISEYLKLSLDDFSKKYIKKVGSKYSLLDLPQENFRCVFLEGKKCRIYPVRPVQCQTYPFWPSVLKSEKDWKDQIPYCEGINQKDALISFDTIVKEKKRYEEHYEES